MEFFKKHQIILFRTIGVFLLIVSLAAFFWTTPKQAYTDNEIAAANVARMEARIAGKLGGNTKANKADKSPFLKKFQDTREKQIRYALILMMIFGLGFLVYSFLSGKRDR